MLLAESFFYASSSRGRQSIPWSAAAQTHPQKRTDILGAFPSPASRDTHELGVLVQSFTFLLTRKRQMKSQEDGQAEVKIMPAFLFGFLSLLCVPQLSGSLSWWASASPGSLQALSPPHRPHCRLV